MIVNFNVMLSVCFTISNGAMKSNRVGLSEYTARRLAELRARRAEADDTGGISVGASSSLSTAAAEATVNDSDGPTVPPAVTTQHSTMPTAYNKSASSSNTTAHVLPAAQLPATQLPSNSHLSSSSSLPIPKTISQGNSAVSNGISVGSPDTDERTLRDRQMRNDKSESGSSTAQQTTEKQDLGNPRAPAEPSKPLVQRREVPQPNPFMKSGSRLNDATTLSGTAVEVGAMSKMVSFPDVPL